MNNTDLNDKKKEKYTIKELIDILDAEYEGKLPLDHKITGVSSIDKNTEDKITFVEDKKHLEIASKTAKGIVITNKKLKHKAIENCLLVTDARFSYAKAAQLFKTIPYYNVGIDQSAVIKDNVQIGDNVSINSNTYIDYNTNISDNVIIAPGVKIGKNVNIGANTVIYPNVVIESDTIIGSDVVIEAQTVIGSKGYGYVFHEGKHYHIPQLGNVIIEDEVEIGACVTIDRGTQNATLIKEGTKIDNQVQIAHNVQVGKNCLIIGQVGLAGSVKIGNNVILAGGVGVIDHVKVGDNVKVGAGSIVTTDLESDSFYLGNPAQEKIKELKARVIRNRLPNYRKALKKLEDKTDS